MSVPYIIIDGYNLMHAAGMGRRSYGPGDLERCRNRLIRSLTQHLSASALRQTTIVFDAFTSGSNRHRRQRLDDLIIEFAPKGEDADGVIEKMLLTHSVPKRVLVVSSDHRLHKAAARRKAKCVDSEDFWDNVASFSGEPPSESSPENLTDNHSPRANEQRPTIDEAELATWMAEFSDAENESVDSDGSQFFDERYLRELEDEFGA